MARPVNAIGTAAQERNELMRMRTKILGIAVVMVGLAVPGGASTHRVAAQELPSVSDVVVWSGCTNFLTPVQLVGGGGVYGFTTNTPCNPPFNVVPDFCFIVSDLDAEDIPGNIVPELIGNCTKQASGSYVDMVCGTGTTGGSPLAPTDAATMWADDPPFVNNVAGPAYATARYSVVFVDGQGILIGIAAEADSPPVIRALGFVSIMPTSGNCVTGVTQFRVTGVKLLIETPV